MNLKKLFLNLFEAEYAINEPKLRPSEKNTCEAAACHVFTKTNYLSFIEGINICYLFTSNLATSSHLGII
jgi:hypothetical protein